MRYTELLKQIDKKRWNDDSEPEEWWHSEGAETFRKIALRLAKKGIGSREILGILGELYSATAQEYGD